MYTLSITTTCMMAGISIRGHITQSTGGESHTGITQLANATDSPLQGLRVSVANTADMVGALQGRISRRDNLHSMEAA